MAVTQTYAATGQIRSSTAAAASGLSFTGERALNDCLLYLRARVSQRCTQTMLTRDSLDTAALFRDQPKGANRMAGLSNPVMDRDPSGHMAESQAISVIPLGTEFDPQQAIPVWSAHVDGLERGSLGASHPKAIIWGHGTPGQVLVTAPGFAVPLDGKALASNIDSMGIHTCLLLSCRSSTIAEDLLAESGSLKHLFTTPSGFETRPSKLPAGALKWYPQTNYEGVLSGTRFQQWFKTANGIVGQVRRNIPFKDVLRAMGQGVKILPVVGGIITVAQDPANSSEGKFRRVTAGSLAEGVAGSVPGLNLFMGSQPVGNLTVHAIKARQRVECQ